MSDVTVALSRDEAEDLCWAYCGHKPAQRSEKTEAAINKFRIAARMGGGEKATAADQIAVTLPHAEAEAMGFDGDEALIDRVLERINEAL